MNRKELMEKAREFAKRKTHLTMERYGQIKKEWVQIAQEAIKGKITSKEASELQSKLNEETKFARIKFDNIEDYRTFSLLLGPLICWPEFLILEQVEHEIEHSIPLKEQGHPSYLGWQKLIFDGESYLYHAFHKPFGAKYDALPILEKSKLGYKSLKSAKEPSDSDEKAIENLIKEFGDKIKD